MRSGRSKTIDERAKDAIEDYLLAGGVITHLPEGATSIDWAEDTRMRAASRGASQRGHEARRKKRKKP